MCCGSRDIKDAREELLWLCNSQKSSLACCLFISAEMICGKEATLPRAHEICSKAVKHQAGESVPLHPELHPHVMLWVCCNSNLQNLSLKLATSLPKKSTRKPGPHRKACCFAEPLETVDSRGLFMLHKQNGCGWRLQWLRTPTSFQRLVNAIR